MAMRAGGEPESHRRRAKADRTPSQQRPFLHALHRHLGHSLFNKACADVRLRAFGRTYALHRILLIQSTFFHSLFNGDFHESQACQNNLAFLTSKSAAHSDAAKAVQLHFDDPNITRAAFEFCVAFLYGAAPELVLPTWSSPTPTHPLTRHFEPSQLERFGKQWNDARTDADDADDSDQGFDIVEPDVESAPKQPATPRFLLSLLATATYLGIPAITSQAMTLILSSITPFTVSHYLCFALGYGIEGAVEAKERQLSRSKDEFWDWELEGPAWGLADLSIEEHTDKKAAISVVEVDDLVKRAERVVLNASQDGADDDRATSFGQSEDCDKTEESLNLFNYGGQWDKIGEACSCWLLRWGADVLLAEERLFQSMQDARKLHTFSDKFLLRQGQTPVLHSLTSDDYPRDVRSLLDTPYPFVWQHPKCGGIPAAWVRAIVSSDSFWIRQEWDRYDIAKRIVSMRRAFADSYLSNRGADEHRPKPDSRRGKGKVEAEYAIRSSQAESVDSRRDEIEYERLFSEGIYYTHMPFATLSAISGDICPYSAKTFAPVHVLQSSLWAQSELKNLILSKDVNQGDEGLLDSRTRSDEDEDDRGARELQLDAKDVENEAELGLVSKEEEFVQAYAKANQREHISRAHLGQDGKPATLGGVTPLMQPFSVPGSSSALEGLLSKHFYAIPVDDTVRIGETLASLTSLTQQNQSSSASATEGPHHRKALFREDNETPCGVAAAVDANTLSLTHDTKFFGSSATFFGLENAVQRGSEVAKQGWEAQKKSGNDTADDSRSEEGDSSKWLKEAMLGDVATHQSLVQKARPSHGWTGFEPMRMGVEFYDVDRLSEKQRSYSPSFFYAGSVWNLYVQTVKKPKGLQLGIYLHRQNCNDSLPTPNLPSLLLGPGDRTHQLYPRTGQDAILAVSASSEVRTPRRSALRSHFVRNGIPSPGSAGNLFYSNSPIVAGSRSTPGSQSRTLTRTTNPTSLTPSPSAVGETHTDVRGVEEPTVTMRQGADREADGPEVQGSALANTSSSQPTNVTSAVTPARPSNAAMSGDPVEVHLQPLEIPYVDQRQALRAYFSIHCPSPMGTSLTKFSSRPDRFTLSQSWGWKSSSLLGAVYLEDGKLGSARNQVSQTFRCVVTMGVV